MSMTPARRHFLKVTAEQSAVTSDMQSYSNVSAYELMEVKLVDDTRRLKEIQSTERKIEYKRSAVEDYRPWVDGVLASGAGVPDRVLMTQMVWNFDIGDFDTALAIAEYALEHNLPLPDQFRRTLPTLIAEEVADAALSAVAQDHPFDVLPVHVTQELTGSRDMHDEVRAKLFKAEGLLLKRSAGKEPSTDDDWSNASDALAALRRAFELNERVGVKKEIEALERLLKNKPAPALREE